MTYPDSRITSFVLKIIAILGMTTNHIANVWGPYMPYQVTFVLYSFGGLTYPTMAFLLVEGYLHTSNLKRYASRLFIFALVAQVPFMLCLGWHANVLFTLLIGLGLLWAYDHVKNRFLFFLIFIGGVVLSSFCDWDISGPIIVFLFYRLRSWGWKGIVLTMAFPFLYVVIPNVLELIPNITDGLESGSNIIARGLEADYGEYLVYVAGVPLHLTSGVLQSAANIGYAVVGFTLATVLMCRYNGKRGRSMKWFFYAYYPAHLLVIWAIKEIFLAT